MRKLTYEEWCSLVSNMITDQATIKELKFLHNCDPVALIEEARQQEYLFYSLDFDRKEKIKRLADQSGVYYSEDMYSDLSGLDALQRFADAVILDYIEQLQKKQVSESSDKYSDIISNGGMDPR